MDNNLENNNTNETNDSFLHETIGEEQQKINEIEDSHIESPTIPTLQSASLPREEDLNNSVRPPYQPNVTSEHSQPIVPSYQGQNINGEYPPYVQQQPAKDQALEVVSPKTNKKGAGIVIGLIIVALIVGMIGISTVSIKDDVGIQAPNTSSNNESIETPEQTTSDNNVNETPENSGANNLQTAQRAQNEPYSVPDAAEIATPAVVGVIQYQGSLYEATGLGSGVIVDKFDGGYYVITNNHVVTSGSAFKIRINDGVELDATVVGVDPQSDLAVLRIKTDAELTVAKLGDSDKLRVGESVIAIGNPLAIDFSGSVTQGIISALNRTVTTEYKINYLQTDAAINPGNSGGALVNMYGELIGINTVKVQGTGLEGLGFAIPISEAIPIIEELINYGKVTTRPILGIEGVEISEYSAYNYNIPAGIMIKGVGQNAKFIDTPRQDDIITHLEGERVLSMAELKAELDKFDIGDTIELTVYRESNGKKENDVKIRLVLVEVD